MEVCKAVVISPGDVGDEEEYGAHTAAPTADRAFTVLLAAVIGQRGKTDELGAKIVENKVHIHDLHATLLWLMGLDHRKLTFRYGGRDQTIADIHGKIVKGVFA